MNKIVFASGNSNKIKEVRTILKDAPYQILSLKDLNINLDVEENGNSFFENAYIKAKALWDRIGGIVMADDSGLVIDFLNGEPGIYSARYLGENVDYSIKNQNIIDRMKMAKKEERSARFVACIVCILENGEYLTAKATMDGIISDEIMGENGFGYDPILYLESYSCTVAQLSEEEKNKISHRAKALMLIKEKLENENIGCK